MTEYKCGHKTDGVIILDDNVMSMIAYIEWAEEDNNLETRGECFDCFLKKKKMNDKENQIRISIIKRNGKTHFHYPDWSCRTEDGGMKMLIKSLKEIEEPYELEVQFGQF